MLVDTEAFSNRSFSQREIANIGAFTQSSFYTNTRFYTQMLLHTVAFTRRSFYLQKLLHRRFDTQKLVHA